MLRDCLQYYNDTEVLHYEVCQPSSSSSSSSASAQFRITADNVYTRETEDGDYRIIVSSSSSSSQSASSSSFSVPFRYQSPSQDLCDLASNLDC